MEYSEKQLKIMEAAEELFSDKGFEGTSVRDIAEAAEVNLAMISYYFGSKDKLLEALFTYHAQITKEQLSIILNDRQHDPLEKFNILIDYYINRFQRRQCFQRIMAREQIAEIKGPIAKIITNMKRTNLELIKGLIQEGQKAGQFKKNIDVPMMMTTLIGSVNMMFTTKHYYKELNNLQALSDEQFEQHIKKKLAHHLKSLFKVTLTHED